MKKHAVTVEDEFFDTIETAKEETKDLLLEYLKDNPDTEELPCLHNDIDYSGRFHETIDSSVPIYTHEIEAAWFHYSRELEEAYENAGVGENPKENDGMAAIYYYLSEQCAEWYQAHAQDIFDAWKKEQDKE